MSVTRFSGPIVLQKIAAGGTAAEVEPGIAATAANVGIFAGSGVPTIAAPKGSLYLRTDGAGIGTRLYVNTDGGTTWTGVTTAA